MDGFYRRAFDVLTSDKVARALDVEREDPRLRDRYGIGSPEHLGDGAPMWNDQLLIARRLVEAGARCVTVALRLLGHARRQLRRHLARQLPLFDQGISALVEDIHARGLDQRRDGGRLGRVRPHAEDQQGRRPRPLGAGEHRPCSPAAG